MIEISKHGLIRGGLAEKEHQNRLTREAGAEIYLNHLIDLGKIIRKNQSYIFKTKTMRTYPLPFDLTRSGVFFNGQQEIGAYRIQDVCKALLESKCFKVSVKKFNQLCEQSTAPVSDLDFALNKIAGNSSYKGHVCCDSIYKARKKDGEIETTTQKGGEG